MPTALSFHTPPPAVVHHCSGGVGQLRAVPIGPPLPARAFVFFDNMSFGTNLYLT